MILTTVLLVALVMVPAIVLHECAHGWMAYRLGDPTAKLMGRLTLNPLRHIDPVGTVVVPLSLYVLHLLGLNQSLVMFGWAKPVPVNFSALPRPRLDKVLVALAGPVTNLVLAFALAQVYRSGLTGEIKEFFFGGVLLNVALAVFNLIPIPPLDGSRVVSGLLPEHLDRVYTQLEPFGIVLVIILVNTGLLDFIGPLIYGIIQWMGAL